MSHFQMTYEDERRWVLMLIQIEKDRALMRTSNH